MPVIVGFTAKEASLNMMNINATFTNYFTPIFVLRDINIAFENVVRHMETSIHLVYFTSEPPKCYGS